MGNIQCKKCLCALLVILALSAPPLYAQDMREDNGESDLELVNRLASYLREKQGPALAQKDRGDDELQTVVGTDEEIFRMDRPFVSPGNLENHAVVLENYYNYESYKDGSTVYNCLPYILRFDTGKNTEARIYSDFYTWQHPTNGVNDINLGFKWQFLNARNASMALMGTVELPTAGGGVGDPGVEPGIMFIYDQKLGGPWDVLINVALNNYIDGTSFLHYNRMTYAASLNYQLTKKTSYYLGSSALCPKWYPNSFDITRLTGGWCYSPNSRRSYTINVSKGLSSVHRDWWLLVGISNRL
ncbi:MAG: hypothetical protein RDV48_02305 [Candidatus Eremiobacteraeota bacterium]|nr:hypothetical protein [Candidatus Eremiobacteraeota bacterium]